MCASVRQGGKGQESTLLFLGSEVGGGVGETGKIKGNEEVLSSKI